MGGGLLQLVAYGAQDVYLTGNPQITFWKLVYRRHSNFSVESIEQSFSGSAGFGKRITAQISRNGDLIHKMWLSMKMSGTTPSPRPGLAALKSVELEVGGQRIDRIMGLWMDIWNELTLPVGLADAYDVLTGAVDFDEEVHVPLEFYFCRNPGLALPLIALQYHDVKVNIEFEKDTAVFASGGDLSEARLWVDYVFLDTDERRRFSQLSHEYLVEQLQYTGDEAIAAGNSTIRLNFNHPVKELIWVLRNPVNRDGLKYYKDLSTAKLQLNGHDRFAERGGDYFRLIQPFQHHTRVPVGDEKAIYVYSFALKPEEHQPSGTLNMSRIDTASLKLSLKTGCTATSVSVFATNYNVLRIMSGMGGLSYAN